MSDYPRPAGIEAFAKCPANGCATHVYGPIGRDNPCRDHGGVPTFEQAEDIYGNPLRAVAGDPPSPASRLSLERV